MPQQRAHPRGQRCQYLDQMLGRGREVLHDPAANDRLDRRLGETGEGQDAEREHRRRPGRADLPDEAPARDTRTGPEHERARTDLDTLER